MTDSETIQRLQAMLMRKDDEMRVLRNQVAGTSKKLDKQRSELARLHKMVEWLRADKATLLHDIKKLTKGE